MRKITVLTTLSLFIIGNSYAKNMQINLTELESKLSKLKEMHALECSPLEVGKLESYLESLKQDVEKEKQNEENIYILKPKQKTDIDYTIIINNLLAKIEKNIYSDKDGDGIPCYKEIELGLNPNVADKLKKEEPKTAEKVAEKEPTISPQTKNETNEEPFKGPVRVHFHYNKASIKKEYLPYLNVVAKYLNTHPDIKVKIVGYTDNRGPKAYNDKLALERAKNVKKYLTKLGVNPSRIIIEGVGKDKYIVSNNNDIDRFTNRRAEFYVINLAE